MTIMNETIEKLINDFKEKYPSLYRVDLVRDFNGNNPYVSVDIDIYNELKEMLLRLHGEMMNVASDDTKLSNYVRNHSMKSHGGDTITNFYRKGYNAALSDIRDKWRLEDNK